MKLKATKTQIKRNYWQLLSIGYCSADSLLSYVNPFGYSEGVYGWACDYYEISGKFGTVCISTGYSPIGKSVNFELLKEYEAKAQKLNYNYELSYQERKEATNDLLNEFIYKQMELLDTNK